MSHPDIEESPAGSSQPGSDTHSRHFRAAGVLRGLALSAGVILFLTTLYFVNLGEALANIRTLGVALPIALGFSGLWHLVRTWAWASCFPQPRSVSFAHLARVRLSAEAFSYLTLRGIAGEPLKVVLLAGIVDARHATAAVALERIAYIVGTTIIVGAASVAAMAALPLTEIWFRVFRAFAIAAAVVAVFSAVAITGRGTYLQSLVRAIDRRAGSALAAGRVGRFVGSVERLMLELVRDNPKRLLVLSIATLACFVCMVLEAWVILVAAGAGIGLDGAVAVETFSRVASFASAFIPANLGALEASSVAAVTAVGATGGAALAIARRIRGLFWAGLGLLIYPRRRIGQGVKGGADRGRRDGTLLYLPHAEDVTVPPSTRLASLPIAERVIRAAARAGYRRFIVFLPEGSIGQASVRQHSSTILCDIGAIVTIANDRTSWERAVAALPGNERVTVVGPGTVVSPALLADALSLESEQECLDVAAGGDWPATGVLRVTRTFAANLPAVERELRRRRSGAVALPSGEDVSFRRARLAVRITTPAELAEAERIIRRSSYKDTDAKVARFNRRMSLPVSIALMRTPVTANQLSVVLVAMGLYSAWLFSLGHYWTGVLGASLSLAASVLDGCDGEIARLKYQESAVGCWIETIGDYTYYLAIFVGIAVGAVRQTRWEVFAWLGGLALCGTLISFGLLIYLRNRITSGQPQRLHAIAKDRFKAQPTWWSRALWRVSFVATRAAMPYGILAFALVYGLPAIVVLAAIGANVYWISLVVKLKDLLGHRAEEVAARVHVAP
jgi:phosphatidylglycerophosphate synthase